MSVVFHSLPSMAAAFGILIWCCVVGTVSSAEILAVLPHHGKSHFHVFEPLLLSLAGRGHQLTVLSFFPQERVVSNYTDVSLAGITPLILNNADVKSRSEKVSPISSFILTAKVGIRTCHTVLDSPQVQQILKCGKKFDLVIFEFFNSECFFPLAHILEAPFIGITSGMSIPHHNHRLGNPDNLSISPNAFLPFSMHMSLPQRIVNTVFTIACKLTRSLYYSREELKIVSRVFGSDINLDSVANKVSLVLVNSHHSLTGALPLVAGYVEVGGLHIRPPYPLSKELQNFMNDSIEGVVMFSMGSGLNVSSMPEDKLRAFLEVFGELSVRVIMRWEGDSLPGKPDNVRIEKWLPQRDVLAHPNIVAFMGHGGLLSTTEAVHCGVPMVLIPVYIDQPYNAMLLETTGAAVMVPYNDVSKTTLREALHKVLHDPRYKENAKSLSVRFKDRPMSPLDTAIYWTEYVLRHKGAPHLRPAAADMAWYQLWLLDVAFVLLIGLISVMAILYLVVKGICHVCVRRSKIKTN